MTSKLTRERLEQLADNNTICKVSWDERIELAQIALAAMDSEQVIADCDPEVYEKGVSACLVVIPKETAEVICKGISAATGCKVDWHYIGGRVHIKALQAAPQPAPVVDSEPVAEVCEDYALRYISHGSAPKEGLQPGDKFYRHAQQPAVRDERYQQLSELYHTQEKRLFKIAQRIKGPTFDKYSHSPSQAIDVLEAAIFGEDDACRAAMLQAKSLISINPAPAMVSLPKNAESMTGNSPVNDVTAGKPFTILLPDISSKAFWSGAGKNETFHPETYRRWVKEAIERYCAIARIDVEVK